MKEERLKPCPFCGGEPDLKEIGNEFTKKRTIEIRCKSCFVTRRQSVIRYSMEWLKEKMINEWNKRYCKHEDEVVSDITNKADLKEIAHWYGGYNKLVAIIKEMEDEEVQENWERSQERNYEGDGNFADNH